MDKEKTPSKLTTKQSSKLQPRGAQRLLKEHKSIGLDLASLLLERDKLRAAEKFVESKVNRLCHKEGMPLLFPNIEAKLPV